MTSVGGDHDGRSKASSQVSDAMPTSAVAPALAVICVLYESGHQYRRFVEAVRRTHPAAPLLLVDNGSFEAVPDLDLPEGVELLRLPRNRGYGQAVNAGVDHVTRQLAPEFVAILNPDVFLESPALDELVAFLEATPRAALVTGSVVDGDGAVVSSAWGPPSMGRAFWYASGLRAGRLRRIGSSLAPTGRQSLQSQAHEPFLVSGHVLGGAMVARVSAMQEVGGFSDRFFLYWEDADLAERMRTAGYEVWFVPTAPIRHVAGTSSAGTSDAFRRLWYAHSAQIYAERHLSAWQSRRLRLGLRLGDAIRGLRGRGRG